MTASYDHGYDDQAASLEDGRNDPLAPSDHVNELFEAQQLASEIVADYLAASEEDDIPEPTDRDRRIFRMALEILLEEQTR